jgi:hypothetical protein
LQAQKLVISMNLFHIARSGIKEDFAQVLLPAQHGIEA